MVAGSNFFLFSFFYKHWQNCYLHISLHGVFLFSFFLLSFFFLGLCLLCEERKSNEYPFTLFFFYSLFLFCSSCFYKEIFTYMGIFLQLVLLWLLLWLYGIWGGKERDQEMMDITCLYPPPPLCTEWCI